MSDQASPDFILGIDLGSNSLGWALIARENGEPNGLSRAGVRVFDAATEGDRESGQEESRNKTRRDARSHRRQLWRRARRLKKVFSLLQHFGLLPPGKGSIPDERQDLLNDLDKGILSSAWLAVKRASGSYPEPEQTVSYILRAAALDEPLEPYFLGRALYHLAQRRGFLSNRLQKAKKDEDLGVVKQGIAELRQRIMDSGARTLGEYFARISPSEQRIRSRWTHRDMFTIEFDTIWEGQARHHPELLTAELKKQLRRAIFYQRPLRFDPDVIGMCQLEPRERRAPAHLLISQRFRLLQTVNNLRLLPPGEMERELTAEERQKLLAKLDHEGDLTFTQVRKLLGLPKGTAFNLERGGEKSIKGNRTFADFFAVLGQRWLDMSEQERDRVVEYVYSFEKPDKLPIAAKKRWGLDETAAQKLADISLEPDYMNLSRRAMEKVLALLEGGITYAEARRRLYPEQFEAKEPEPLLPPVEKALAEIRNPAVMRSLTELRKVINAIIRQHGKPSEIHVELARDLRKTKKQRQGISERMRENERARKEAAKRIFQEVEIKNPSPDDIRKVLLAEECRWECPYTGKAISMRKLVGHDSEFQIEHIIPFSRSLDNSFVNLTLCHVEENKTKSNRTPFEAYSGDSECYERILARVRNFSGNRGIVAEKLRRFQMTPDQVEDFLASFSSRQLTDTAYASRLASQYLGLLYGGLVDAEGTRRVQATSGQVTAYLRNLWQLNTVLKDGATAGGGMVPKARTDHRHHAVDATAIALTDPATIKALSDAAQRAPLEHRRRFASIQAPWPDFVDSVRDVIDSIVVSHRVSKKVSGALHEETIYSRTNGKEARVRKWLDKLTKSEVEDIADEGVKQRVLAKLGDGDPKKIFSNPENIPFFETADGRRIPIKRVRIKKAIPTFALGDGRTARHVTSESNHHLEVIAELDERGNEVEWDGVVVPMAEVYRRKKLDLPIVQRDFGPKLKFKFSLGQGEAVECDNKEGGRSLFVFRKVTQFSSGGIQVGFAPHNDARKAREMQVSRAWLWTTPNTLGERHARKVVVSPLGEVMEAHD
ncbi:MAG: type II CRISPR RNA-guided endonuclease Cas9 [Terriglobia bacterium]